MGAYQKFLEKKKQEELEEQNKIEIKEEIQEVKNVNKENKYQVVELNLNELDYYKNQPFKEYNQDEMNNLKESIERIGLQNAIVVRKKENDLQIGFKHNSWYGALSELGDKNQPKRGILRDTVFENIDTIQEIQGQYLSALSEQSPDVEEIGEEMGADES